MHHIYFFLLALAVSVDGLMVGFTYALRQIRLPMLSRVIISAISSLLIGMALMGGRGIAWHMDPALASGLGGTVLLVLGVWATARSWSGNTDHSPGPYLEVRLPRLGLVIAVLREPASADLDKSGSISASEACVLGIALALDAFGVGFGAGMAGNGIMVLPPLAGVGMFLCLGLGYAVGQRGPRGNLPQRLSLAPGGLIALLGFIKIMGALPQ